MASSSLDLVVPAGGGGGGFCAERGRHARFASAARCGWSGARGGAGWREPGFPGGDRIRGRLRRDHWPVHRAPAPRGYLGFPEPHAPDARRIPRVQHRPEPQRVLDGDAGRNRRRGAGIRPQADGRLGDFRDHFRIQRDRDPAARIGGTQFRRPLQQDGKPEVGRTGPRHHHV